MLITDLYIPVVSFDDPEDDWKSEPGPYFFRRKEGVENFVKIFQRDSLASIRNIYLDILVVMIEKNL